MSDRKVKPPSAARRAAHEWRRCIVCGRYVGQEEFEEENAMTYFEADSECSGEKVWTEHKYDCVSNPKERQ